MHIAQGIVLLLHLVGFAALLGGVLVQLRSRAPEVSRAMLLGAWTALVTGIGLVVLLASAREPVNYPKFTILSVVTLFVLVVVVRNRRYLSVPRGLWALIGGLTLVNAGLSVFWR